MLHCEAQPSSYIDNPDHFRNRARETRGLVEDMTDELSRQAMLRIADIYEDLARRAEQRLSDLPALV
jgi:hypothetical protein